jgi:16S rRNA (guanine527-N7)-methyltransferase
MDQIRKYFPELQPNQYSKLESLHPLYREWNLRINVISRKDIDHLFERHVLHSLAIAKFINFTPGTKVIDIGTGGGFPGLPLAIVFPEVEFILADSIGKKIKVVNAIIEALSIQNAQGICARVENINDTFDFVICRAVARMDKLLVLTKKLFSNKQRNALPNGLIALKGGILEEELKEIKESYEIEDLGEYFEEEFFQTKKLVYVQLS